MGKGCKILFQDCDPSQAQDRGLPYSAYLVEYIEGDITKFDIATGPKQVDIFDDYWDKYRDNFVGMVQTEGRLNPKMYGYVSKDSKKK